MTINQAHNYIKLEADKTSSLSLPAFEPEEIDYWLDTTILSFVKTRLSGMNHKKESFEESQKRIDDLRSLVTTSTLTTPATAGPYTNSLVFDLPATYLFSVGEAASITIDSITKRVPIKPTNQDKIEIKLQDPFSEHLYNLGDAKPLRLYKEDQIILIGDGNYTINSVYLTFLREPEKMVDVVDRDAEYTDLSDQAMFEIVKLVAKIMLANIGDQRYQSQSIEVASME